VIVVLRKLGIHLSYIMARTS